jgi:hypothetical protein
MKTPAKAGVQAADKPVDFFGGFCCFVIGMSLARYLTAGRFGKEWPVGLIPKPVWGLS